MNLMGVISRTCSLSVGHFDPVMLHVPGPVCLRPLDEARVRRAMRDANNGVARRAALTDGFVHFPSRQGWTRADAESCFAFAELLAASEGCVAGTCDEVFHPSHARQEFSRAGERLRNREVPAQRAAESALLQDDVAELRLLGVLLAFQPRDGDVEWARDFTVRLAGHRHYNVRGNAVRALSYLAVRNVQRHERGWEPGFAVIRAAQADVYPYVRAQAGLSAANLSRLLSSTRSPGFGSAGPEGSEW